MYCNFRGGEDRVVCGCSDGSIHFFSLDVETDAQKVRVVKKTHRGAVLSVRWSEEGTAVCSVGEDGVVKIWSKNGDPRSTIAKFSKPIYDVYWSQKDQFIFFIVDNLACLYPIQPSKRKFEWEIPGERAICYNLSPLGVLALAEGDKLHLFDTEGKQLHSRTVDEPILNLFWGSKGETLLLSSFNSITICDNCGFPLNRILAEVGTLYGACFNATETLAGFCSANGAVGSLSFEKPGIPFGSKTIYIRGANLEISEPEKPSRTLNYPLGDSPVTIITSMNYFIVISQSMKLYYYSESLDLLANLKINSVYSDKQLISLTDQALAFVDPNLPRVIQIVDPKSGRPVAMPLEHNCDIVSIELAPTLADESIFKQTLHSFHGRLIFRDRNADLYVATLEPPNTTNKPTIAKLCGMVNSACWHSNSHVICAVVDRRLTLFLCPSSILVDQSLFNASKVLVNIPEIFHNSAEEDAVEILKFADGLITLKRVGSDGAIFHLHYSSSVNILHRLLFGKNFREGLKLCRFVAQPSLWAVLGFYSLISYQLDIAEQCYQRLDRVDRVFYLRQVARIPLPQAQRSEILLMLKRPDDAENVLLKSGLVYRAINLNMKMFKWQRALEIAIQHKTHVDTVLFKRQQYLNKFDIEEKFEIFRQYNNSIEINPETIKEKLRQEMEKEEQMAVSS
eukprot:TRINITY_DN2873_c0_g6_i1.p1 TRINITY_DN2873_c0_g6~~TRINITY_DN2873_c0_g6_i1.p1  ORF type:complete len:752 (-),score=186.52 TRINITY_DN2873_c0_g6_i1:76-2112(-)